MKQETFDLSRAGAETRFAIEAVSEATKAVRQLQELVSQGKLVKSDDSPVTTGDFAGQALIGHRLSQTFPEDALVGEERAEKLAAPDAVALLEKVTETVRNFADEATPEKVCEWIDRGTASPTKRFWTVDPIDGTKGYLRGEQYAVALALIINGKVELGVLGCPHLNVRGEFQKAGPGALFVAARGQGAWARGLDVKPDFHRLTVSGCKDMEQIRILRSVESGHTRISVTELLSKQLRLKNPLVPMDSQAKYAKLAAGGAEAFFYLVPKNKPDTRMKIWDVAPGSIIVEEAGGCLSDLEGKPLDFGAGKKLANNPGIVVTNGPSHGLILEELRRLLSSRK